MGLSNLIRRVILVLPKQSWNLAGCPRPHGVSGMQLEAGNTVLLLWEAPNSELNQFLLGFVEATIVSNVWSGARSFGTFTTLTTANPLIEQRINSYQPVDRIDGALSGELNLFADHLQDLTGTSRTLN